VTRREAVVLTVRPGALHTDFQALDDRLRQNLDANQVEPEMT
jgi:hypothetical protein